MEANFAHLRKPTQRLLLSGVVSALYPELSRRLAGVRESLSHRCHLLVGLKPVRSLYAELLPRSIGAGSLELLENALSMAVETASI